MTDLHTQLHQGACFWKRMQGVVVDLIQAHDHHEGKAEGVKHTPINLELLRRRFQVEH